MLTDERKKMIIFYLSNCKTSHGEDIKRSHASMVHQFRRTMRFCDPDKLNWENVDSNLLGMIPESGNLTKRIESKDFIEICKKLCTRWR